MGQSLGPGQRGHVSPLPQHTALQGQGEVPGERPWPVRKRGTAPAAQAAFLASGGPYPRPQESAGRKPQASHKERPRTPGSMVTVSGLQSAEREPEQTAR